LPGYIYSCRPCNNIFTQIRPVEERDKPAVCETCNIATTRRLFWEPLKLQARPRPVPPPRGSWLNPVSREMIPGGVPNFELKNVRVINFDTGIKVDGTARVLAEGLELSGNRVSIDISDDGELHDFNTTIE
jgi:putative FmdB family regulatory protein